MLTDLPAASLFETGVSKLSGHVRCIVDLTYVMILWSLCTFRSAQSIFSIPLAMNTIDYFFNISQYHGTVNAVVVASTDEATRARFEGEFLKK